MLNSPSHIPTDSVLISLLYSFELVDDAIKDREAVNPLIRGIIQMLEVARLESRIRADLPGQHFPRSRWSMGAATRTIRNRRPKIFLLW